MSNRMQRHWTRCRLLTALLLLSGTGLYAAEAPAGATPLPPQRVKLSFTPESGDDSLRVRFTLVNPDWLGFNVHTEKRKKPFTFSANPGSQHLEEYVAYSEKARRGRTDPNYKGEPYEKIPWSKIYFRGLDIDLFVYPWFHGARGLYDTAEVRKKLPLWKETYADALHRETVLEAHYDAYSDCVRLYLDNQYAGRIKESGPVIRIEVHHGNAPLVSAESFRSVDTREVRLPALLPSRAHDWLKQGAQLSLEPGLHDFGEVRIEVFAPEESMDTGRHRETTKRRDLGWSAMASRTAFATGPDFMTYCLPAKFYAHAYVLCADLPQTNRVPVLGTNLSRYGNLGQSSIAFDRSDVTDPAAVEARGGWIREVGTLRYEENGAAKTTPLYLVKHRLDFGNILDIMNDAAIYGKGGTNKLHRLLRKVDDYLDFEFVGNGTWSGFKRSSLQIFGCTLVESPYAIEMAQTQRGNIFANDEVPETGVQLTPRFDNTRGSVEYSICDAHFNPIEKKRIRFRLKKAGEPQVIKIPLQQKDLGWYGLDFRFFDEEGELLAEHAAAFALLGEDTREAGFESPYAAWPHSGGGHNNNPDRFEVADLMRKAGYRKTWYDNFPVLSEAELPDHKITVSMYHFAGNPGNRQTPEQLQKRLDQAAEKFREMLQRFPHLDTVMVLHETGGRDLAPEMLNYKAIRGEYLAEKGNWDVYFCTEVCKRIRKDFPGIKLMIGNGSSSSEKIAELVSNGFDLDLVDYLGIESKGFQSMPELNANRESPGMAWALKATAKRFGYDLPVSACHEYVFRPEREVTPRNYMFVTDYTVRDYLLSLGHGMKCISTGHLEDTKGTYYDTNWGAGGQCKDYPYSYPKRMFVALATLTKVFDKVEFSRRVPTGELSTYALEFRRNRRQPDYAYAFWTPKFDVQLRASFPRGTTVRSVDIFGRAREIPRREVDKVIVNCGSSAHYLIADKPVESVTVLRHSQRDVNGKSVTLLRPSTGNTLALKTDSLGIINPTPGKFRLRDVTEPGKGPVLEAALIRDDRRIPEVVWEYQALRFHKPIPLKRSEIGKLGVWVKGNSSFGYVYLCYRTKGAKNGIFTGTRQSLGPICFEGWHLMQVKPSWNRMEELSADEFEVTGLIIGSARQALDPLEMQPVTTEIRIGNLVAFPADGTTPEALAADLRARRDRAVMSTVDDKDL